jgi:flagellar FliJ protein
MGVARKNLQAEEVKLRQLKAYREEYLTRFSVVSRNGLSAPQMLEYRAFLDKLDQAVRQQEKIVAAHQVEHRSKQDDWRQTHSRSEALNKVVHRYQEQERKSADRREQKESDDRTPRGST